MLNLGLNASGGSGTAVRNGGMRDRDSSVGASRSASVTGRRSGEIIEEEDEDEIEEVDTFSSVTAEAEETIWEGEEGAAKGWVDYHRTNS